MKYVHCTARKLIFLPYNRYTCIVIGQVFSNHAYSLLIGQYFKNLIFCYIKFVYFKLYIQLCSREIVLTPKFTTNNITNIPVTVNEAKNKTEKILAGLSSKSVPVPSAGPAGIAN